MASQVGQSIHVEPIDLPQAAVEGRAGATRWLRSPPLLLPFLIFCILLEIVPVIVLIRDSLREQGSARSPSPTIWSSPIPSMPEHQEQRADLPRHRPAGALVGGLTAAAIIGSSERWRRWSLGSSR